MDPRVRSGPELVKQLSNLVTKKVQVGLNDLPVDCLASIPGTDKSLIVTESGGEVTLQHYYICSHPSKSGWLSDLALNEYVEGLPRYLNLLDIDYRHTDFGDTLAKGLVSRDEQNAFDILSTNINPLILTLPQKVFFLYLILASDGDFIIPFVHTLSTIFGASSFSYLDAGNRIPEVIRKLIDRSLGTSYTREDREQLRRMRTALESIEKAIEEKLEKKGSGSRREQTAIPRIEWLIDLGLAEKAQSDECGRCYRINSTGHRFASLFSTEYERLYQIKYAEEIINSLLDESFYSLTSKVYREQEFTIPEKYDIVEYLKSAYQTLVQMSGYCTVRPTLLLANAQRLGENKPMIEYKDALSALELSYRSDPQRVYYTITRKGTDYQMKFNFS